MVAPASASSFSSVPRDEEAKALANRFISRTWCVAFQMSSRPNTLPMIALVQPGK